MKLKQQFIDFINNNDFLMKEKNYHYFKVPLKYNNGYAVYMLDGMRFFNSATALYLGCVNEKGEFLHLSPNLRGGRTYYSSHRYVAKEIIDHNLENIDDIMKYINEKFNKLNAQYDDFEEKNTKLIYKILDKYKSDIEKTYDYAKSKELGIELYKNPKSYLYTHTAERNKFNMDPDFVSAYHSTKYEEFIEEKIINDKLLEDYQNYIHAHKALEDYKIELESDPELIKRKKIIDVLLDDKYQSVRIYHTLPNGTEAEFRLNKNASKHENVKKEIVDDAMIYNIPISAVNKIVFRKDVLFDKKDFKSKEYSLKELAMDYMNAKSDMLLTSILNKFDDDKDVMAKLFKKNSRYYNSFDDSLKKDPDFMLEILTDHIVNKQYMDYYFVKMLEDDLFKNKHFVNQLLNVLEENNDNEKHVYSINNTLTKTDESLINDKFILNVIKRFDKELKNETVCAMLKKNLSLLDNIDFIKEMMTYNCIQNSETKSWIVTHIEKKEILTILFDTKYLAEHLCDLSFEIYKDRDFIIELLKQPNSKVFSSNYINIINDFLKHYSHDKEIMNYAWKNVKNTANASTMISVLDIEEERAKILEMTSYNLHFFNTLTSIEKEVFIDAECLEIDEMQINIEKDDKYIFEFKTLSATIKLQQDPYKKRDFVISMEDEQGNNIKIEGFYNRILKHIHNFLSNEYENNLASAADKYNVLYKLFIKNKTKEEIEAFRYSLNDSPKTTEDIEK